MTIRTVALIGATGKIGAFVLDALVAAHFSVTVLQRASSSARPAHASTIQLVQVPDDLPAEALARASHGHDAAVICIPLTDVDVHLRLATAAARAGVTRYVPADFGSVDAGSARAQELVPLFARKTRVREHLDRLAVEHGGFTWTSIVSGHFFDWALKSNFMHFDVRGRKAEILGHGAQRSSLSTLARIADATVRILRMAEREETRNKVLFIQSFCVTQLDILEAVQKATGAKWEVEWVDVDRYIEENKAKADAGDKQAVEDLVFALGVIDGDWEQRPEFSMDLLGLQNEDLQTVVDGVIKDVAASS
ncbi:hypothetical protein CAC42_7341 [Sphaceloma murrayae]|uniref:NmrA-like domain-containing protein n=1 Tax=Sphaceloma murrayae TaxID=2082308 RepID=A0A2K1QWR8_9PEZI|nr:hypothetical protein CAC42_7341 [Sphaceloma murrayae]